MEEIYKDLQLDHWEMAAAKAMLLYLQHICGDEARKLMRPIVDVNMYSIEGSTAQPVQNVIDDTKLAEVIDLAIGFAADLFNGGWNADGCGHCSRYSEKSENRRTRPKIDAKPQKVNKTFLKQALI